MAETPPAKIAPRQVGSEWIWIITGPTACGKSTIAKYLTEALGMTYIEGDDVSSLDAEHQVLAAPTNTGPSTTRSPTSIR